MIHWTAARSRLFPSAAIRTLVSVSGTRFRHTTTSMRARAPWDACGGRESTGSRPPPAARESGLDWPEEALTMMGTKRLSHLEACVRAVVREDVPGDLLEAGVWRGGGVILMRAALEALGDRGRTVWAADSFEGLPAPD